MDIMINGKWALRYSQMSEDDQAKVDARMQSDYGTAMIIIGKLMLNQSFVVATSNDRVSVPQYDDQADAVRTAYEQIRLNRGWDATNKDVDYDLLLIERELYRG